MLDFNSDIKQAAKARKSKDFTLAKEILDTLYKKDPENKPLLVEYGMYYKDIGDSYRALEIFNFLLDSNKRVLAYLEIASIYLHQSDYTVAQNKEKATYLLNEALNNYKMAYNEAIEEIKAMDFKKDSEIHQFIAAEKIALIYKKMKQLSLTCEYLKKALELADTSQYISQTEKDRILANLANINLRLGNANLAYDYYSQMSDSKRKYSGYLNIELAFYYNKEYDKVRSILQEVATSNTGLENYANLYLGKLEVTLGNFDIAYNYFNELLNTNAKIDALDELIALSYKCNNLQLALYYIDQVLNLGDPKVNPTYYERYKKIIQSKLDPTKVDTEDDIRLELECNYIPQRAFAHVRRCLKSKGVTLNVSLKELFYSLELKEEDYRQTNDSDIYYIHYPNIMSKNDESYNYINVATIVNTKNIIGIFPAKEYTIKDEVPSIQRRLTVEKNN